VRTSTRRVGGGADELRSLLLRAAPPASRSSRSRKPPRVFHTLKATVAYVVERRGYLLLNASMYAFMNGALASAYAVSKAGVEQLGRALRTELRPHGATAGVPYFGFIDTALVERTFSQPGADRLREALPGSSRARSRSSAPPRRSWPGSSAGPQRSCSPGGFRSFRRCAGCSAPSTSAPPASRRSAKRSAWPRLQGTTPPRRAGRSRSARRSCSHHRPTGGARRLASVVSWLWRLEDRVADNIAENDITESETLLFGSGVGVATDIESGPNGNLFVVSLSHGAVYEILRR
jgi:hypothetical protein